MGDGCIRRDIHRQMLLLRLRRKRQRLVVATDEMAEMRGHRVVAVVVVNDADRVGEEVFAHWEVFLVAIPAATDDGRSVRRFVDTADESSLTLRPKTKN